jgi:hypothetical protein
MRMKLLAALILLAAGLPVEAQLKDRFEVVSARTSLPSPIENSTAASVKRVNPELLIKAPATNRIAALPRL